MAAVAVEQGLLCDHQGPGDSRSSSSSRAQSKRVRSEFQLSDFKADSCATSTATLAQSTKMKALCKRGRGSEVRLAFCFRFHRGTASRCQCCVYVRSALLKACESFKEKAFFCYRISAA